MEIVHLRDRLAMQTATLLSLAQTVTDVRVGERQMVADRFSRLKRASEMVDQLRALISSWENTGVVPVVPADLLLPVEGEEGKTIQPVPPTTTTTTTSVTTSSTAPVSTVTTTTTVTAQTTTSTKFILCSGWAPACPNSACETRGGSDVPSDGTNKTFNYCFKNFGHLRTGGRYQFPYKTVLGCVFCKT